MLLLAKMLAWRLCWMNLFSLIVSVFCFFFEVFGFAFGKEYNNKWSTLWLGGGAWHFNALCSLVVFLGGNKMCLKHSIVGCGWLIVDVDRNEFLLMQNWIRSKDFKKPLFKRQWQQTWFIFHIFRLHFKSRPLEIIKFKMTYLNCTPYSDRHIQTAGDHQTSGLANASPPFYRPSTC